MNLDIRENEKLRGFFLQSKSLFEDEEAGLGTSGGLPSSQGFVLALTPSWGWAGQGVGRWEQGVWRLGGGGGWRQEAGRREVRRMLWVGLGAPR